MAVCSYRYMRTLVPVPKIKPCPTSRNPYATLSTRHGLWHRQDLTLQPVMPPTPLPGRRRRPGVASSPPLVQLLNSEYINCQSRAVCNGSASSLPLPSALNPKPPPSPPPLPSAAPRGNRSFLKATCRVPAPLISLQLCRLCSLSLSPFLLPPSPNLPRRPPPKELISISYHRP